MVQWPEENWQATTQWTDEQWQATTQWTDEQWRATLTSPGVFSFTNTTPPIETLPSISPAESDRGLVATGSTENESDRSDEFKDIFGIGNPPIVI